MTARLEAAGHTVHRVDLDGLEDHEVAALAADARRRLRAIAEATNRGWVTT
jgi:ABC-type transport system involved in cytochrome c biogenesis ATPase subunit